MPIPISKDALYLRGLDRIKRFCEANSIQAPVVYSIPEEEWAVFSACAFYRPTEIKICLKHCGYPAKESQVRNWTWPGTLTDREPFGVLCHELGHHVDWLAGDTKGRYWSSYGLTLMNRSGEPPISGYFSNPAEWFAEMFRLFCTNHALLDRVRPRTYELIRKDWKPVSSNDWTVELGSNVPPRILANVFKKIRRS